MAVSQREVGESPDVWRDFCESERCLHTGGTIKSETVPDPQFVQFNGGNVRIMCVTYYKSNPLS